MKKNAIRKILRNAPSDLSTDMVQRNERIKKSANPLSIVKRDEKPLFMHPVYRAKKHDFF